MSWRWDDTPDELYERLEDHGQHVGCDTYADLVLDDLVAAPAPSLAELVDELVGRYVRSAEAFRDKDGQVVVRLFGDAA